MQFDHNQPYLPQLARVMENISLTAQEFQSAPILVNLPSFNAIAALVLAELHGRMGYFPPIVRLKPIEDTLPMKWFEYIHYKTARSNVCMLENLGGDLAQVAGRRITMGAFPWRWVNGEGCICRVVAFPDAD